MYVKKLAQCLAHRTQIGDCGHNSNDGSERDDDGGTPRPDKIYFL